MKTTVGQIGVGYWGPNTLRNLVAHPDVWVKTAADLSEDRRNFVRTNYPHIAVVDEADGVLNDPEIEAVAIATPATSHHRLAMQALDAGKHVLVEKPMATSVEEVREIGALADRKSLVAMVGHTFIYNSAVRFLKTLIDSGEVGEVRYIYSQRLNLGRIRSDVDALWNLAPHDISVIQFLLGDLEPISVVRHGMDYVQNGIDDVVFLNLEYPGKVMASLHVSWLDPVKVRRMTVVGSKKMVVYDDIAAYKIAIYDKGIDKRAVLGENMDFDTINVGGFNYRSGDVLLPLVSGPEPLKAEISHFIDCIQHGTTCLTGPRHAEQVVRILGDA